MKLLNLKLKDGIRLFSEMLFISCMLLTTTNSVAYNPNRIKRPYPTGVSDPLPEGWKFRDIGNIAPSTDWCYKSSLGLYYLKAYGNEMSKQKDDCAFIYTETDQDMQVQARIMDGETVKNVYARGFVMVRGGMASDDRMALLNINNDAKTLFLQLRSEIGGVNGSFNSWSPSCSTAGSTHTPPDCYPRWLKIVRQGKYIQAYQKDDLEDAEWSRVGNICKVGTKGKVYMGIGASANLNNQFYNNDRTKPAIFLIDNVSVSNIEIPYEVSEEELVTVERSFYDYLKPGRSIDVDITKLFGHAIGEYFTVECESLDPSVMEAYFWEKPVEDPVDGEEFRKFIRVKGLRDGVTSLRLSCTIKGFTMQADFTVAVSNGKAKKQTIDAAPPFGWEHINLEIPVNPDAVYGDEFVRRNLLISKRYPSYIGSWEYDWGGRDIGNHARTPGNNPPTRNTESEIYVGGASSYTFRDELMAYSKADKFAKDTVRAETGGAAGSDIDLAFYRQSPEESSHLFFLIPDSTDVTGIDWNVSRGLYTRRITEKGFGEVILPYITNIQAGDWVSYTVNAPREGYYVISAFTGYKSKDPKYMRIDVNGIMQVPELKLNSGFAGNNWSESVTQVFLRKGKNHLKMIAITRDFNFLGFSFLFHTLVRSTYSGLSYDTTTNFRPKILIDTTQMEAYEKQEYDSIQAIYDTSAIVQKMILDSLLRGYPKKTIYDTTAILSGYARQLDSLNIPYTTHSEKLSALDTIANKLIKSIDTITFYTNQRSQMKHIDVTSFLYKRGYDPHKPIEISMKIDSVANSGIGTYVGVMMRTMSKGELPANSPFFSFGVGSYEGGRFAYRWGYDYNYKKLDNPAIAQDVYIRLRLNFYAPNYVTAYYSYDNLFWWEYLQDPLRIDFMSSDKREKDIAVGLYFTGGVFTGDICQAMAKVSNIHVNQYESVEDFERQYAHEEMINYPLTMSSTTIRRNEPVDITYNVCKPGIVSLKVFDSYGMLKEVIMDGDKPFSQEPIVRTHVFTNLTETGIYLLRLNGPNNEQYLRFRYIAE